MESLWILIPLSLVIAIGIGAIFWWAVTDGQMDDLDSPGQRILIDNDQPPTQEALEPAKRLPVV
jgi:cbb3-type cytochrome oxidase maturation protein